ncbi:hypothetical protein F5Y14DRAFT_454051 [Nemania sp. NC0429]|nr:hypothetical protein F5Y14DRAFT_454051 [Nemania sp. NC0429]
MRPRSPSPRNGRRGQAGWTSRSASTPWLHQPVELGQLPNGRKKYNPSIPFRDPDGSPVGFDSSDSNLLSPPSPCGHPILDPNENNQLGTFFNGLASNQYNPQLFDTSLQFSEQWFDQDHGVAPNLLAHSTSYGPHTAPDLTLAGVPGWLATPLSDVYTFGQNSIPTESSSLQQSRPQSQPPPFQYHPPPPSQPFYDNSNGNSNGNGNVSFHVLSEQVDRENAAALLTTLQSGYPNVYSSPVVDANGLYPSSNKQPERDVSSSLPPRHAAQIHHDPAQINMNLRDPMYFTQMVLGQETKSSTNPASKTQGLQWGSDTRFDRPQAFIPPAHESSEALERRRIAMTREAFSLSSTPNTRAPSPIGTREATTHTTPDSHDDNFQVKVEENITTTPTQRRRSNAPIEGEDGAGEVVRSQSKSISRKRKSKGDHNGSPESSSAIQYPLGKRRKSVPSQSKQRENLTDEQKRENHIKSEQKRRGAIKSGFDDLIFIVPNLQDGSHSKSNMLNMAGEWLEKLIKGNQTLELEDQSKL